MTAVTNYCRVCQRPRDGVVLKGTKAIVCCSCASPLTTTPVVKDAVKTRPPCPNCGSGIAIETEPDRFTCSGCRAVFERCETAYSGHRPHENVEKKEAYELRQAARQRDGRRLGRD